MATNRLTIDGYGQIELNNVAFRRDGRIEAQCKPDATDFSENPVENGMLLAVDNVTRTVAYADASATDQLIALVYSAEHMYDERTPGLKNFKLNGADDFLPRLGYLAVGDKFTTNTVCYDTGLYANDSALKSALKADALASAPVFGGISTNGAIALLSQAPSVGPVLKAVKGCTMPDGTYGIKFHVAKD